MKKKIYFLSIILFSIFLCMSCLNKNSDNQINNSHSGVQCINSTISGDPELAKSFENAWQNSMNYPVDYSANTFNQIYLYAYIFFNTDISSYIFTDQGTILQGTGNTIKFNLIETKTNGSIVSNNAGNVSFMRGGAGSEKKAMQIVTATLDGSDLYIIHVNINGNDYYYRGLNLTTNFDWSPVGY